MKRAEKRLYQINHKTYPGDIWSIVVTTETPIGQKILSLQSMVQVCLTRGREIPKISQDPWGCLVHCCNYRDTDRTENVIISVYDSGLFN